MKAWKIGYLLFVGTSAVASLGYVVWSLLVLMATGPIDPSRINPTIGIYAILGGLEMAGVIVVLDK